VLLTSLSLLDKPPHTSKQYALQVDLVFYTPVGTANLSTAIHIHSFLQIVDECVDNPAITEQKLGRYTQKKAGYRSEGSGNWPGWRGMSDFDRAGFK
jgi:hypothetical protein